jgi:hypothetical protein
MKDTPIRHQLSSAKSVQIHTSSAIQISLSKSAYPNQSIPHQPGLFVFMAAPPIARAGATFFGGINQ